MWALGADEPGLGFRVEDVSFSELLKIVGLADPRWFTRTPTPTAFKEHEHTGSRFQKNLTGHL